MPDVEFRKHQVLYMRCKSSTGEVYKVKVYFMKPKEAQGFSKVQNLRSGKIFTVETARLECCDE